MINYLTGNLFDFLPENPDHPIVIPHVCNDQGVWGSGFVIPLKKKFPRAYEEHNPDTDPIELGISEFIQVADNVYVFNMIAQTLKNEVKPLKYWALNLCMLQLHDHVNLLPVEEAKTLEILAPKFGSLRAGGNWDFITEMMEELWTPYFKVTVCEYEEPLPKGFKIQDRPTASV